MTPNKLGKIGRVHVLASAEYRQTHFHVPPVTFHFVSITPEVLPRSYLPLPPKNISLNLLLYRQIPIVLQLCALDGISAFPPCFHQFEPLSLTTNLFTFFLHGHFTCFSAKHIPVDSCVSINVQLFLYLLLR